jgi:hypothetical protein
MIGFSRATFQHFSTHCRKHPGPAILVGGQSLTFWVDYFKIPVPKGDTPYLTQDADVLATKHDARSLSFHLHCYTSTSD